LLLLHSAIFSKKWLIECHTSVFIVLDMKTQNIDFDSNPGNKHSAEYNSGYVRGYNDGWEDAKNGVQDPKC
jgi:hypothetical protein